MKIPEGGYIVNGVVFTKDKVPCERGHGEGIDFNYALAKREYHRDMSNKYYDEWKELSFKTNRKDKADEVFSLHLAHYTEAHIWDGITVVLCSCHEYEDCGNEKVCKSCGFPCED